MLQKIEPSLAGLDFEVICSPPFGRRFNLVPPVDDLFDLDPIPLEAEPPRRFIGLVTGVAFNFDENRLHGLGVRFRLLPETNNLTLNYALPSSRICVDNAEHFGFLHLVKFTVKSVHELSAVVYDLNRGLPGSSATLVVSLGFGRMPSFVNQHRALEAHHFFAVLIESSS
jgi:hypothetical protein